MRARTERTPRVELRKPLEKMKYPANTKKSNVASGALGTLGMQNFNDVFITGGVITGITDLLVADGGTGASTLTDHGVLVGSGTSPITALAVGTNGQVLVGSTGADPVFATITDGNGITTTLGAGSLSIEVTLATNSGLTFSTNDLAMGTPSSCSAVTTNSVSGSSHTHAITGFVVSSTPCIVTTTYTVLPANDVVIGNSTTGFTITLMAASGSGRKVSIKNINTGNVTLEGDSSDTIDGSLNVTLVQWDSITVYDYATNKWVII